MHLESEEENNLPNFVMLIFFVLTVFFQDICPQKVIRNVDKNLHLKMHIAVIYK